MRPRTKQGFLTRVALTASIVTAALVLPLLGAPFADQAAGIRSITPPAAFVGDAVTITGAGLGGPNVRVTVHDVPAPILEVIEGSGNPTAVMFRVPAVPTGPTDVIALNPGGQAWSIAFLVLNHPPVASAGPDQTVVVGSTVQLDGHASTDADGDPLTFTWSFVSRPTGSAAALDAPTAVRPMFVVDHPGTYVIQLVVNDGQSDSAADTVQIDTRNSPPVANAGPDQTVRHGSIVQLDGTASSDVDGDALTFRWSFQSRPEGSRATLIDPSIDRPAFLADLAGRYVIELVVNDGTVDSRLDTVQIDTTNSRPQADSGPDQTVTVGSPVTLDGTGSSDADGDPLTFRWSFTVRPESSAASLSDPADPQPTFVPDRVGTYIVQLIVNDGSEDSAGDTVVITALPVNLAPVVSAGADQTITLPTDTVALNGSASDDGLPAGTLTIAWSTVSGPEPVTFDNPAMAATTAHFSTSGTYRLRLTASDGELSSSAEVLVTVNPAPPVNQPPVVNAGPDQTITLPASASLNGTASDDGLPGAPSVLTTTWTAVTDPGAVTFADAATPVTTASFSASGVYVLRLTANDGELSSSAEVTITVNPAGGNPGPPPDPRSVAPPLPLTEVTGFAGATAFLYSGPDPIQTGVTPGAIEPRRAAVLRGRVLDRDGAPLAGVAIRILSHPELGQTLSRTDGAFDLAVNGGGSLTLTYTKAGFLPVQRAVVVPWQDFTLAPDVVMIPADPNVTVVDVTAAVPIQVARGSVSTDADGSRQATVFFPQGTQATMVLPDGSTQPLTRLSVRATEYTVGPNGPAAMPAKLPPTSGYTYAVELSVDEALAAGATTVRFSRPVPSYVENFLNFPVGDPVPVGTYDRQKGAWLAEPNGRVIKILGVTAGLADLDVTGDGAGDTGAALSDLGIDDAERAQLATLYAPGTSLWRVPLSHFSPKDYNWPTNPPNDAIRPQQRRPVPAEVTNPEESCDRAGSIIRCESQALGERIGLAGTPYQLVYTSERVLGRGYHLDIPLTVGVTPPPSLRRIEVDVTIAGVMFTRVYSPAAPNLVFGVDWDGRDVYGRFVQGQQLYGVEIRYVYLAEYQRPATVPQMFALASGVSYGAAITTRAEFIFFQRYTDGVGGGRTPPAELGGWSLSHQHHYDPAGQVLYLGTGEQRSGATIGRVVTTVFDQSTPAPSGDEFVRAISAMAVGPDGSIYFADQSRCRVRKLTPDGSVVPFAGGGLAPSGFECSGAAWTEGAPATTVKIRAVGIAVGPDGSVYLRDDDNFKILRVDRDGFITTVAGNGQYGSTGDGGPATDAAILPAIGGYSRLAVGPDGSVTFSETTRIRRVGPDGFIHTIAGTGVRPSGDNPSSGDGGPATEATLWAQARELVALGPDGSIFVSQYDDYSGLRLRRITPDGVIRAFAGGGAACSRPPCGDGGPATQARFVDITDLAVGPDGSVLVWDLGVGVIRQIAPDGIINTIAGLYDTTGLAYRGDGRQATATQLFPGGVVVSPDKSLLVVSDTYYSALLVGGNGQFATGGKFIHAIRRLAPPSSVLTTTELAVPSRDGREIYVFTGTGRHLRTVHALTNAVLRDFAYDPDGRLVAITERTGGLDNVTTIERAGGQPVAIVGPFGQRTQLTIDGNDYFSGITNPANETIQLVHDAGGLLTQLVDPRGGVHRFTYDALGLLIRDEAPDGGATTLARVLASGVSTVTLTTAEGRTTTYRTELLSNRDLRRVITGPSGAQTTILRQVNAARTTTMPDGTVETVVEGPDPRWGLLAPVTISQTVRLPSGLTRTITGDRTVTLADPADLFALATLNETLSVNGRLTTRSFTAGTRTLLTTTPAGRPVTTILDGLGRATSQQAAGLNPLTTTYDSRGRVATVNQGGRTTTFGYGPNGDLASVTDAAGRTVTYVHDAAGRIVSQTRPDGTVVGFAYDRSGNLVRLTPPDRPDHAFDYTPLGLMASYVAPGGVVTGYSYNRDRQLTRETRPDGKLVNLAYDAAGRFSSETIDTGAITATYDTANRLTRLTAPGNLALAFGYNGFLVTSDAASGVVAGTVGRAYDPSFRLTSRSLNGNAIGQTYDADNLLTGTGSLTLVADAQNGLLSRTTLGVVTTALTRNGFGEVVGVQRAASGQDLYTTSYVRDDLGRITSLAETIEGITTLEEYRYDAGGRLLEVQRNGELAEQYEYDTNGNRTRASLAGTTSVATYDTQDRLLTYGGATLAHSPAGEWLTRTLGGQTTAYAYDTLGNLVGVTLPNGARIAYLIDARSRRVGKQINGTLVQGFLYQDRLRPIAELDGAGVLVSRFVYRSGRNVPDYMIRGGVTYRILTDHRGSPRLVVDAATGAIAQRMDYDAFGRVLQDTNPGIQPFGFAGGLYDRDTGLVRFGRRDYDPVTGRWTAKDPIRFAGGDANLYAYVQNDPVNRVDPLGLYASVCVVGNTVFIDIPIAFEGTGATDANIQLAKDAIHHFWSGQKGQYQVNTSVSPGAGENANTITLEAGDGRSNVWFDSFGTWYTGDKLFGNTAAHEAGHLLGLDDRYSLLGKLNESWGTPDPGWENNIMAGNWGGVEERNIREIIANSPGACGCGQ